MNGKAAKECRKFASMSYEATKEEEKPSSLRNYYRNIKKEYTRNVLFGKFVRKMNRTDFDK